MRSPEKESELTRLENVLIQKVDVLDVASIKESINNGISKFGKIDTGVLSQIVDVSLNDIIKYIKDKDFGAIRKWVASNDVDPASLYRKLYDNLYEVLKPQSIPQAVVILADYQYKQAFVADQEINLVACLTELMVSLEFK